MESKNPLNLFKEIKIEMAITVLLTVLMAFFWKHSWFVTISLFVIFVVAMFLWERRPYDLPIYIVIFLLAPLIDLNAIPAGAWFYGNPDAFNIPFWLFTGYALGLLVLVRIGETTYRVLNHELDPNKPSVTPRKNVKRGLFEVIGGFFIHLLLILTIVMLWHKPIIAALILIGLFLIQKAIWEKHPYDNYIFVMTLIFATIVEWVSVYYGSWTYPNPAILNVALYIPFAYSLASVNVFKIFLGYQKIISKK